MLCATNTTNSYIALDKTTKSFTDLSHPPSDAICLTFALPRSFDVRQTSHKTCQ